MDGENMKKIIISLCMITMMFVGIDSVSANYTTTKDCVIETTSYDDTDFFGSAGKRNITLRVNYEYNNKDVLKNVTTEVTSDYDRTISSGNLFWKTYYDVTKFNENSEWWYYDAFSGNKYLHLFYDDIVGEKCPISGQIAKGEKNNKDKVVQGISPFHFEGATFEYGEKAPTDDNTAVCNIKINNIYYMWTAYAELDSLKTTATDFVKNSLKNKLTMEVVYEYSSYRNGGKIESMTSKIANLKCESKSCTFNPYAGNDWQYDGIYLVNGEYNSDNLLIKEERTVYYPLSTKVESDMFYFYNDGQQRCPKEADVYAYKEGNKYRLALKGDSIVFEDGSSGVPSNIRPKVYDDKYPVCVYKRTVGGGHILVDRAEELQTPLEVWDEHLSIANEAAFQTDYMMMFITNYTNTENLVFIGMDSIPSNYNQYAKNVAKNCYISAEIPREANSIACEYDGKRYTDSYWHTFLDLVDKYYDSGEDCPVVYMVTNPIEGDNPFLNSDQFGNIFGKSFHDKICALKPYLQSLINTKPLNNQSVLRSASLDAIDPLDPTKNDSTLFGNIYVENRFYDIDSWPCESTVDRSCAADDSECMSSLTYTTESVIKEVAYYCNNLYNTYYKQITNEKNKGTVLGTSVDDRMEECISFDNLYNSLVQYGIINDLSSGCGGLTQDALDIINYFLNLIKIAGPLIAIGLGIVDFFRAVVAGETDKEMKAAGKRFMTRLIAAVLLLLIPIILSFLMNLFLGDQAGYNSDNPFCIQQSYK